ncbi:bifunctional diaminohydroxyphosphoribosylaminopyrimidine deaminase/5-amino-6-(5-phosphoribosylamino)uracil reductase RibD [Colwellia sp. MEBiC06753]
MIANAKFSLADHQFMTKAIALAKFGHYTTSPNPRVGCVIVKDGEVVGEGFHQKAGEPHAEVHALKQAGNKAEGATAYVTLEPCSHYGRTPPCAKGLIDAKVAKVIAAMVDPNPQVAGSGLAMLNEAGIITAYGLLADDARALNLGFISLMERKRPYVRCKLASSLDGQTAMASGESKWITSPLARQEVQRLRAQSCAVISGANTVIIDNAKLTVRQQELGELAQRYPQQQVRQPVRVIIDGQNRLTPDLALFSHESPVIIISDTIETEHQWPHFVSRVAIEKHDGKIALAQVISYLGSLGLNDLFIESGVNLAGAFIDANLVDELILFQAPKLMGSGNQGLVCLPSVHQLVDAKSLNITDVTMVGSDLKIVATFNEIK